MTPLQILGVVLLCGVAIVLGIFWVATRPTDPRYDDGFLTDSRMDEAYADTVADTL